MFNGGRGLLRLRSNSIYNDNNWHSIVFSRDGSNGKMVIDELDVSTGSTPKPTLEVKMSTPFYLGGVNLDYKQEIFSKLVSYYIN